MLRFITSIPAYIVRETLPFIRAASVEDAPSDSPRWAETVITARADEGITSYLGTMARAGYRIEGWKPKPAIADPTFALAAAAIERGQTGGSSAAAAWK